MSTPNSLLANPETLAAMSRFFYDSSPVEQAADDSASGLHAANQRFYKSYKDYLKHPLSQVATLEIGPTDDRAAPPLHVALGFDTTWANHGILGWYLQVAERARNVTSYAVTKHGNTETSRVFSTAPLSTHGSRVFLEYTAPNRAVAAMRRLDAQGRLYSSLMIATGDRPVSAPAMHNGVTWLLRQADVAGTAAAFETTRSALAQKIANLLQEQGETPRMADVKRLNQARADYEKVGFNPMHRSFPIRKPWETTDTLAAIATIHA